MARNFSAKYRYRARAFQSLSFLAASLILLWPAAINGSPLVFFDSLSYLHEVDMARHAVSGAPAATEKSADLTPGGLGGSVARPNASRSGSHSLRSIGYPA